MQNYWLLSSKNSEEDKQTLEESNSAHRRSQPKCQLVQTSYLKRVKLLLFCHIINILLTELSRSVWENLDLGRVYRPHCVRSVLTTSVKILPYRPPARLINIYIYIYDQKSNFVENNDLSPYNFFFLRKEGRSFQT